MRQNLLALLGALVGGAIGYAGVFWLLQRGFLGLALPGGLLGLGAGIVTNRGRWVAVVCGVAALGLGLLADHQSLANPPSVGEYLVGLPSRNLVTLIMVAVGTVIGFYVPFARHQPPTAP